jgi:hypothetical protein
MWTMWTVRVHPSTRVHQVHYVHKVHVHSNWGGLSERFTLQSITLRHSLVTLLLNGVHMSNYTATERS